MIRVIGIDIPRGWAVVDFRNSFAWSDGVAFGELDLGREVEHFAELVDRWKPARVALETPLELYVHGRGGAGNGEGVRRSVSTSLITCARLAGRMEDRAWTVGGRVAVVVDADEVRKALGIRGRTRTEKDQAVKQYVQAHVRGWPARSNADERDAAVVAIYGGMTR